MAVDEIEFGVFVRGPARLAARKMDPADPDYRKGYRYDLDKDRSSEVVRVYVKRSDPGEKTREVKLRGDERRAYLERAVYGDPTETEAA